MASDLYDLKDPQVIDRVLGDISYNLRKARLSMAVLQKAKLGALVVSEPEFEATLRLMETMNIGAGTSTSPDQSNLPLPSVFMKKLNFPQSVKEVVPLSAYTLDRDGRTSVLSYPTTRSPSIDIGSPPLPLPPSCVLTSSRSTTPPPRSNWPMTTVGCIPMAGAGPFPEQPRTGAGYDEAEEGQLSMLRLRTKVLDRRVDALEQRVDDWMSRTMPDASKRPSHSKSLIVTDSVDTTFNSAIVASSDLSPSLSRVPEGPPRDPVSGAPQEGTPLPQNHPPTIHKTSSETIDISALQDVNFDPLSDTEPAFAPPSANSATSILDYLAQLDPSFSPQAQVKNPPIPATPLAQPSSSSRERDRVEDLLMCDFLPLNQAESSLKVPDASSRAETPTPSPSSNAALNKTGASTRKVYFHNLTPHVAFPPLKLPDLPNDVLLQRLPGDNAGAVLIVPRTMEIDILKPLLSLIRTLIEKEGHGLMRPVIRPGGHPMSMLKLHGVYFVRNGTQTGIAGQRAASSLNDVRREVELKHPIVGAALVPVAEGGKTVMLSGYAGSGGGGGGKRRNSALAGSGIGNANGALTVCDVALQVRESRVVQVQAYLTRMADPTKILLFGRDTVVEMLQLVD